MQAAWASVVRGAADIAAWRESSDVFSTLAALWLVFGLAAFVALQFTVAPYGKYTGTASALYGPKVPGRLAWVLQESPCVVAGLWCWLHADPAVFGWPNKLLLGAFLAHYVNRTIVFPLRIRDGAPTPLGVMLLAFGFCMVNGCVGAVESAIAKESKRGTERTGRRKGSDRVRLALTSPPLPSARSFAFHRYAVARSLTAFVAFPPGTISSPRFLAGLALFALGAWINVDADARLRALRDPAKNPAFAPGVRHYIPRGGAFEWVSGANFFGEIVEWTGFALAAGSASAAAFAFFTFCNIGPRGAAHHAWYLTKFKEEYPKGRRAVIPLLW
jgi:3-oxo-5-alpha-steroid 4-dehydrogenase 1